MNVNVNTYELNDKNEIQAYDEFVKSLISQDELANLYHQACVETDNIEFLREVQRLYLSGEHEGELPGVDFEAKNKKMPRIQTPKIKYEASASLQALTDNINSDRKLSPSVEATKHIIWARKNKQLNPVFKKNKENSVFAKKLRDAQRKEARALKYHSVVEVA